ncbi:hypothetical protein DSO57_1020504 [Entomophthora muscae]|uniref:Uncharacterized protein n=1 Tax=Entomophthora muscae TaxID=34485 RepID=A0ACC2RII1_9FUNG|nr:hypothetical protein DSO57_1020504 [Entomophthora muscae]
MPKTAFQTKLRGRPPAVCRPHGQLSGARQAHAYAQLPPPSQCLPTLTSPPAGDGTPLTAGPSTPAGWGNCSIGKPKKEISPNLKIGKSAAQIWNLPNLEGVDKQPSTTINASTAEVEFDYIKVPEDASIPCNVKDKNSLPVKPLPSQSQMRIPDNTKYLGFPVQCFALFMPYQG